MIPTKIDHYQVETLFITDTDPSEKPIRLQQEDGLDIFIPDFCFDIHGRVISRKDEETTFIAPIQDAWVNTELLKMAEVLKDQKSNEKYMYVVWKLGRPKHVSLVASEKPLSVA